jgi:hypothetical protein
MGTDLRVANDRRSGVGLGTRTDCRRLQEPGQLELGVGVGEGKKSDCLATRLALRYSTRRARARGSCSQLHMASSLRRRRTEVGAWSRWRPPNRSLLHAMLLKTNCS